MLVADGTIIGPVSLVTDRPPIPVLVTPGGGDVLLLETGGTDNLLLESGDNLLLE